MNIDSNKKPVTIGLIGLGKMGQNHLRLLTMLKDVQLEYIYDKDTRHAEKLAAENDVKHTNQIDTLLEAVEAVIIAAPTSTHADYIHLASQKVKSIFVEKPMSKNLAEAEQILALSQQQDIQIQVGFIERFNPSIFELKNILEKTKKIVSIDFTRTNKLSDRIKDVDVITDLMVHDIDLAIYLNGPVANVSANGYTQSDLTGFAIVLLEHKNGNLSRLQASRVTEKKIRKIQATCIDMYVECDMLKQEVVINRQSEVQSKFEGSYYISSIEESVVVQPQEALLSELQCFIELCKGNIQDNTPLASTGRDVMVICEDIQKALSKT